MRKLIILLFIISSCSKPVFKSKWTSERSPESFAARFETSKGSFDIEVNRNYSPLAVDRLYQLLKHRLFDNTLFYRVRPNYVAQFGISDTTVLKKWEALKVSDEPVIFSNKRSTIAFARGGKDDRSTALYINLKDNNPRLDTIMVNGVRGYPPFGTVTRGMEVVDAFYSGYGDTVFNQEEMMYKNRAVFLDSFPKLDLIRKAYILKRN